MRLVKTLAPTTHTAIRLPFGRAANKLDTALKEFGQCLAGADVGCQPAAYLAGIRLFAKYYAWHAALTPAERRFAFMIAHALKGLSFIPSQPDRPYRLVAPTGEIIAIIGELVDSASIRDAGAAESACEALERLDIVIWPQIGEDAGDYEALMDTDDDEQEQDEQQEE